MVDSGPLKTLKNRFPLHLLVATPIYNTHTLLNCSWGMMFSMKVALKILIYTIKAVIRKFEKIEHSSDFGDWVFNHFFETNNGNGIVEFGEPLVEKIEIIPTILNYEFVPPF